jgi:hypothetical protein
MSKKKGTGQRRQEFEDETNGAEDFSRHPSVDPDERDEYDEWRRERGTRGRKRKDKAGGRHRRHRDEDQY